MKFLDLTIGSAAADVALDEALLEAAEGGESPDEILRLWQPASPIVVLGRSSVYQLEVNQQQCDALDVEIVRRCSGGAAILTSPDCLMYAVILSYERRPELRMIDNAHQFVMNKIKSAIQACGVDVQLQGICDLTIGNQKVSGNALRCKRRWLVYHGTLICKSMDIALINKCLGSPRRQPEYRANRSHAEFLTRIPLEPMQLRDALLREWKCCGPLTTWPEKLMHELVLKKYTQDHWTKKV